MTNDFDLGSKDRLFNLINKDNKNNQYGIVINDTDIELGTPTPLTEEDKNTELVINSKPNTRTIGTVTLRYNRLDLSGLKDLADIPISIEGDTINSASVVEQINNVYGCNISVEELEEFTVEEVDYEGSLITLRAKSDSLAWINEIELLVKLDQGLLSDVFTNIELRGLRWSGLRLLGNVEILHTVQIAGANLGSDSVCLVDDWLYLVGGTNDGNGGSNIFNKVNVNNGEVVNLPSMGTPVFGGFATVKDNSIIVFGGYSRSGTGNQNKQIQIYNIETNTWSSKTNSVYVDRRYNSGVVFDDGLVIGGVSDGAANRTMSVYKLDSDNNLTKQFNLGTYYLNYSLRGAIIRKDNICYLFYYSNGVAYDKYDLTTGLQIGSRVTISPLSDGFISNPSDMNGNVLFIETLDGLSYFIHRTTGRSLVFDIREEVVEEGPLFNISVLPYTGSWDKQQSFVRDDECYSYISATGTTNKYIFKIS